MPATAEKEQVGQDRRFRVTAKGKTWEGEDVDDAFWEADFALMDGARKVVIEVVAGDGD